jgi:hypothetical protein
MKKSINPEIKHKKKYHFADDSKMVCEKENEIVIMVPNNSLKNDSERKKRVLKVMSDMANEAKLK